MRGMIVGNADPPCGKPALRVRVLICKRGRYTQIAEKDRAVVIY